MGAIPEAARGTPEEPPEATRHRGTGQSGGAGLTRPRDEGALDHGHGPPETEQQRDGDGDVETIRIAIRLSCRSTWITR